MKSDIKIKSEVYKYLKGSALDKAITGKLFKRMRVEPSVSEDAVVSVLSNSLGQNQLAYVNVNVYVQDIQVENGEWDENQPRLDELCDICFEVLERVNRNGLVFELSEQRILKVNGKNEHVINNKLLYKVNNEEV